MIQLKVNGTYLDLIGDEEAKVTFAVNDFGSLTTRQGFQSTDFTIPSTAKNIAVLETTERLSAEVLDDDSLLGIGFVQVVKREREKNTFTVSFFLGNSDWIDLLSGVNIRDLNYDEYDHYWTDSGIIDSFENESGYTYPIIDYGKLSGRAGQAIMVTELFPATYVSTIIKKAFSLINYKLAGAILKSPYYLRKVLPYAQEGVPVYDEKTKNLLTLKLRQTQSESFSITSPIIQVNQLSKLEATQDLSGAWDNTLQSVEILPAKWRIIGSGTISVFSSDSITVAINLINGAGTLYQNVFASGTGSVDFSFDLEFESDNPPTASPFFVFSNTVVVPDLVTISNFQVEMFPIQIIEGSLIKLTSFMPSLEVTELLKHLVYEFNLFFQVNPFTKTVTFYQFDEVIRNLKNAVDWTTKVDYKNLTEDNYTEILQNYARQNLITYTPNDADTFLVSYQLLNQSGFGDGILAVNNQFIPETSDLYQSPFTATLNVLTMDETTNLPYIPIYELNSDGEYEPNLSPGIRILFVLVGVPVSRFSSWDSIFIQETGSSPILESNVPYGWFSKSEASGVLTEETGTMCFGDTSPADNSPNLIDQNYRFYAQVLDSAELIKLSAKLDLIDILNLDFSIPIFLKFPYYSYFRINRIVEWSFKTRICRLELMKL